MNGFAIVINVVDDPEQPDVCHLSTRRVIEGEPSPLAHILTERLTNAISGLLPLTHPLPQPKCNLRDSDGPIFGIN